MYLYSAFIVEKSQWAVVDQRVGLRSRVGLGNPGTDSLTSTVEQGPEPSSD